MKHVVLLTIAGTSVGLIAMLCNPFVGAMAAFYGVFLGAILTKAQIVVDATKDSP